MYVSLGNQKVYVEIIHKNNRNLYFRFDEDLNLIVTCPKNTHDDEIIKLIEKNEDALLKMYKKASEKKEYDSQFWYLGKKYNIIFDENIEDVKFEGDILTIKDEIELSKFIENKIVEIFTKEAEICAQCFNNLPEYKLKFRKMKTRWGVCNRRDNTITLNTELIKKDERLLDYVIIHEMAHFYEGNHSKAFWNIVSQACPDYKKRRAELKK